MFPGDGELVCLPSLLLPSPAQSLNGITTEALQGPPEPRVSPVRCSQFRLALLPSAFLSCNLLNQMWSSCYFIKPNAWGVYGKNAPPRLLAVDPRWL